MELPHGNGGREKKGRYGFVRKEKNAKAREAHKGTRKKPIKRV